jgi:putative membrane protein
VKTERLALILLLLTTTALAFSAINPYDRATWWLEILPVLIGMSILIPTYKRFPLTQLLYGLLFVHALVLILGGHYTYANVPAGFWLKETFDLDRNPYDRIGHFMQGFVPAILAREILVRRDVVSSKLWRYVFVTCICLAFSAFYELIEWWVALLAGGATDFLGTQGDVWDTQWDMCLALLGALIAQISLGKIHDRALSRLR